MSENTRQSEPMGEPTMDEDTGVDMQAQYWTWEQAAAYGGVTRQTMQSWAKGRVRRAKLGRKIVLFRPDVMELVEEKRTPQPLHDVDG